MNELQSKFAVSERRACLVIDQPRQSQRYQPKVSSDEPALLKDILNLVREFPRYGYRLICGKLRQLGWTINPKRVYRIWKKEGLKVPIKKQKNDEWAIARMQVIASVLSTPTTFGVGISSSTAQLQGKH